MNFGRATLERAALKRDVAMKTQTVPTTSQSKNALQFKNVLYATDFRHDAELALPYTAPSRENTIRNSTSSTSSTFRLSPLQRLRMPCAPSKPKPFAKRKKPPWCSLPLLTSFRTRC